MPSLSTKKRFFVYRQRGNGCVIGDEGARQQSLPYHSGFRQSIYVATLPNLRMLATKNREPKNEVHFSV